MFKFLNYLRSDIDSFQHLDKIISIGTDQRILVGGHIAPNQWTKSMRRSHKGGSWGYAPLTLDDLRSTNTQLFKSRIQNLW